MYVYKNTRNPMTKERTWNDTTYPYRVISRETALKEFLRLREIAARPLTDINPRSIIGNRTVDWGTERMRRKTKKHNYSHLEMWNDEKKRAALLLYAKRLHSQSSESVEQSIRNAINTRWSSMNTMRSVFVVYMYKMYKATSVLDFTAGWGSRMIAAMALDIDYIGIDSNKALKPGYDKLIKLLQPYTNSKITMIWKEAQTVDMAKLPKYDYVFTSPPYEYLEVYEHMSNFDGETRQSKFRQPASMRQSQSQSTRVRTSADKFYDIFLLPTLQAVYKNLPKHKFMSINIPSVMYEKIVDRWGVPAVVTHEYTLQPRPGWRGQRSTASSEFVYSWRGY